MDAFAGILSNPIVLTLVGLLIKFFPPLAKIPNAAIPYINTLLAFLSNVLAPQAAHASSGPLVIALNFGAFSFLGPVAGAVWQSVQASLLNEFFLRHPIAMAGIKKAVS